MASTTNTPILRSRHPCLKWIVVSVSLLLLLAIGIRRYVFSGQIDLNYFDSSYVAFDDFVINFDFDTPLGKYVIHNQLGKQIASGTYEYNVGKNGWNYLSLFVDDLKPESSVSYPTKMRSKLADKNSKTTRTHDDQQFNNYLSGMRALGYLEGRLTCEEINQWVK